LQIKISGAFSMTRSESFECIEHDGIVQKSDGKSVTIRISSATACSGCHSERACNLSDIKEKIVEVKGNHELSPGDNVTVMMKKSMGHSAVFLGYGIPLILVISVLIILAAFQVPEIITGLGALAILIPYYFALYFFRNRISKKFTFSIKAR
jgi:sigma-E factor negative regulatory protein RseC